MDRRFSLILGLGLGALSATTGCTPSSLFNRTPAAPQTTQSRKEEAPPSAAEVKKATEKDKPTAKRKPKAITCVTYGNYVLKESMTPGLPDEKAREIRNRARVSFEEALRIDPKCIEAHVGIAQIHVAEGSHERAVTTFEAALKLYPKEAGLWYELGMTHSRLKQWDKATQALLRAADLDPNNKKYANMVGFALARSGDFQESLVFFTRVVGEARARYNIARMMLHLGKTEEGKQQLELALKMEPNLKEAASLMASLEGGDKGIVPVQYQPEQ